MPFTPIQPIQMIQSIADLQKPAQSAASENSLPFQSLFQEAVNNVKTTDANLNQEVYKLATGQSDDLHSLTIASQKATMSVQLLVQLRNKALDAYNEIMHMSV